MRRTSRRAWSRSASRATGFKVEAGAFHGQEPDEDRLDLDTAALDSYAVRASWADGPWSFQVSGGRSEDARAQVAVRRRTRLTASASYLQGRRESTRSRGWRRSARTAKCSATSRRICSKRRGASGGNAFYRRVEAVAKDILDAGFHPIGVAHTHRQSQIGALTLGYMRDCRRASVGHVRRRRRRHRLPTCPTTSANRMARRCRFTCSCAIAAGPARASTHVH